MKGFLYFLVGFALVFSCTFSAFAASTLKGIPVAQVGTQLKTDISSLGHINAKKPTVPYFELSMVADMNTAPVITDAFVSAGPVDVVTPETFPNSVSQNIGKPVVQSSLLKDVIEVAKNAAAGVADHIKNLISANTAPGTATCPSTVMDNPIGSILESQNGTKFMIDQAGGWGAYGSNNSLDASKTLMNGTTGLKWVQSGDRYIAIKDNGRMYMIYPNGTPDKYNVSQWSTNQWRTTSSAVSFPPGSGAVNTAGVAAGINDVLSANPDEYENLVKNSPAIPVNTTDAKPTVNTPSPGKTAGITQKDLDDFFKRNTAAVAKAASDAINIALAADPNNAVLKSSAAQAAADAAKAAADANTEGNAAAGEEDTSEDPGDPTFAGVPAPDGYGEAYQAGTGEEDIPGRFSDFLGTVKESSLFSFSSSFFGGVPSGGQATYEIEAGRYGHHTVDLSATMSTGMDILKSILLVCFSFLSIRCIIMKR